jgi:hypothetical protein
MRDGEGVLGLILREVVRLFLWNGRKRNTCYSVHVRDEVRMNTHVVYVL